MTEQTGGGLVVAVLGGVSDHDAPVLRRMLTHARPGLAFALDVDAWVGPATGASNGTAGTAGLLNQMGWRSVTIGPQDRLAPAWQELGRGQVRAAAAPPGAAGVPA